MKRRRHSAPTVNMLKGLLLACAVATTGCADGPTGPDRSFRVVELGSGINPDIAGDRVVWQRFNGGPILHLDLATDRLDTLARRTASVQVDHPTVHGNRVAWMEISGSGSSIALLRLGAENRERVTDGSARDRFPELSDELLVWERRDAGGIADIFMRNPATGRSSEIAPSPDRQVQPKVNGHRVVWTQVSIEDGRATNHRVRMFDTETGQTRTITEDERGHGNPDVSGSVVVWVAPGGDIAYLDVEATGSLEPRTVATEASFPAVSVPWIVWVDRATGTNIRAHHIETGETFPITSDGVLRNFPEISGSRVIWNELQPDGWKVMTATLP